MKDFIDIVEEYAHINRLDIDPEVFQEQRDYMDQLVDPENTLPLPGGSIWLFGPKQCKLTFGEDDWKLN